MVGACSLAPSWRVTSNTRVTGGCAAHRACGKFQHHTMLLGRCTRKRGNPCECPGYPDPARAIYAFSIGASCATTEQDAEEGASRVVRGDASPFARAVAPRDAERDDS